jgi:tRNA (mo5U34)-methyltransferase
MLCNRYIGPGPDSCQNKIVCRNYSFTNVPGHNNISFFVTSVKTVTGGKSRTWSQQFDMSETDMRQKDIARLRKMIAEIGAENVYRSIYDADGNLIAAGKKPVRDEMIKDFAGLDFKGKSVVDLGCNFGLFSILCAKMGAGDVLGIDYLPKLKDAGHLLAGIHGVPRVRFATGNIENPLEQFGKFDVAMMLDYLGKGCARKGKTEKMLSQLVNLAEKEIILILRPVYHIRDELEMAPKDLARIYPGKFVCGEYFELLNFTQACLGVDWEMRQISTITRYFEKQKALVLFQKKPS